MAGRYYLVCTASAAAGLEGGRPRRRGSESGRREIWARARKGGRQRGQRRQRRGRRAVRGDSGLVAPILWILSRTGRAAVPDAALESAEKRGPCCDGWRCGMAGDVQALGGRDVLENARRDCCSRPISALRLAQASPDYRVEWCIPPLTAYVNAAASMRPVRLPRMQLSKPRRTKIEPGSVVLVWNWSMVATQRHTRVCDGYRISGFLCEGEKRGKLINCHQRSLLALRRRNSTICRPVDNRQSIFVESPTAPGRA